MAASQRFPLAVAAAACLFLCLVSFLNNHPILGGIVAIVVLVATYLFLPPDNEEQFAEPEEEHPLFRREEMFSEELAGTIKRYDQHVFITGGNDETWAEKVVKSQPLVATMQKIIKKQAPELMVRVTSAFPASYREQSRCAADGQGVDAENSIIVFPDMVLYRGVTPDNVEEIVQQHLINGNVPRNGVPLMADKWYVFVCCHTARDTRCGHCGPQLLREFRRVANLTGNGSRVRVFGCSHIGGHKFAGNMVIFGRKKGCGQIIGDWYGYVTPSRVPDILAAVAANRTVPELWRGEMGMEKADMKKLAQSWLGNGDTAAAQQS